MFVLAGSVWRLCGGDKQAEQVRDLREAPPPPPRSRQAGEDIQGQKIVQFGQKIVQSSKKLKPS